MNDNGSHTELELKLREQIEISFNSVIVPYVRGPTPMAPTGEPFIEFMGGRIGMFEEEAFGAALAAFVIYASDKTGVLYWRVYPEIENGRFYMRLLISDAPTLAIAQEMK
jgi:hypothetical protein